MKHPDTSQGTNMETDWHNLYGESWKGLITDEAFAHPAKFSRALIRKIYTHLLEDGLLKPGDTVLDPFGGVALGGHDAMRLGLHWVGCELEAKFHALGNGNITLWRERYAWFPGTATLLNGDSRKLAEVLCGGVDSAITSPPYVNSLEKTNGIDPEKIKKPGGENSQSLQDTRYGETYGQLGAMPAGDFSAAISSPPFGEAQTGGYILMGDDPLRDRAYTPTTQGQTDGQLAAMKMDGFEGAVSSPPFEDSLSTKDEKFRENHNDATRNWNGATRNIHEYGNSEGQIGNTSGDSFWLAARQIVEQVYLLLAPGAPAVWVVKDYVRNKQIVPFCDQWRQLCEAVGFETLHIHRAWLVEERGTQLDLMGNAHTKTVERKSFFRRLAEKKGSPRIDWETVICMQKPK